MMHGSIVAIEAAKYAGPCGELAGGSCVAEVALFFENGVRFGEPAAAVNAGVLEKGAFGDPQEREQRQQEAEPEFGAFQRRRPLEIVEVDTLGEFFCCACACHVFKLCSKSYTNEAPCL